MEIFDRTRIVLVPDHFTPNKDIKTAEICKTVREFAKKQGIVHYYEVGRCGIEHAFLPEQGLILPGDLIIGGDSHTCTHGALGALATGMGSTDIAAAMITGETWLRVPETIRIEYNGKRRRWVTGKDLILHTLSDIGVEGASYKAMEFCGESIETLSMDARFTICNMAVEAGAKNGIMVPDEKTIDYVRENATNKNFKIYESDLDAEYSEVIEYEIGGLEPQVALPHSPANAKPVSEISGIKIDQVFIGSCTNGRFEDLEVAAKVLKGRRIHEDTRLIVIPATQRIYSKAMQRGLIKIFIDAGAFVSGPTCGPCLGGHMGVLGEGERCVSTSNRNFVGRMGHQKSEVYLANAAIAAASAIKGEIASPADDMVSRKN